MLEQNEVAILLRSDSLDRVGEAWQRIDGAGVLEPISIRKGFAGGGFDGKTSLPKQMAMAAGVPGADLIPETSELFLGFTSTQKAGLGPARIANLETLGYADLRGGYFHGGTHMHLSHIEEDLEAWFLNFDFSERVDTAFRPNLDVADGTQTVPQEPDDVATSAQIRRDFRTSGRMGHSASIQITSRLQQDVVADDGTVFPKGTAIPQRADFNTLDNPFFWSAEPGVVQADPDGGRALRRLQPDERRLPPQPARDGRRLPGREAPVPPAGARPGLQRRAADDAPAELPRAAAAAPLVPAGGAQGLSCWTSAAGARAFPGHRSRCGAGGDSMGDTAPESPIPASIVPRAVPGGSGGRLRRPGGDAVRGRA